MAELMRAFRQVHCITALLVAKMVLLPGYLAVFLGEDAAWLLRVGPFVHAFTWLIAAPLVLAALTQFRAARSPAVSRVATTLGLLPVPATALVLFEAIAAVVPQLGPPADAALRVVPIYIAVAIVDPSLGWLVARRFRLEAAAGRSIAFSTGTRNSLVVLPLALAVPGAVPVLPAIRADRVGRSSHESRDPGESRRAAAGAAFC